MLTFALAHPYLAALLTWAALLIAARVAIRGLRALQVLARGWPPAHLDADGDWEP